MIKYSIITVCLNAGDDLKYTINNLLQQDYQNFEIIVKDGGSTDGSIEGLPKDKRLKLIQRTDNGIYDAMNQAIELAEGDYILFINAGDGLYRSNVLSNLVLQLDNTAVIAYGHNYNTRFKDIDVVPKQLTKPFCFRSMICHQATIYRATEIKNRRYDTSFRISADREWMMYAVVKKRYRCQYIPLVVSEYKSNGLSSSKEARELIRKEDAVLRRKYYSGLEIILYSCKNFITLPFLRRFLALNPRWSRFYKKIVRILYKNSL